MNVSIKQSTILFAIYFPLAGPFFFCCHSHPGRKFYFILFSFHFKIVFYFILAKFIMFVYTEAGGRVHGARANLKLIFTPLTGF